MSPATVLLLLGIGGIFLALLLSLTAIVVLDDEVRGVDRSLAVLAAFSAARPETPAANDPPSRDRVVSWLLDRLLDLGRRLTPAEVAERLRIRLEVAGNPPGWSVDRIVSLKVVGLATGLAVGALGSLASGLGAAPLVLAVGAGAGFGFLAPDVSLYRLGYHRTQAIQRSIADALDLLTISVESGLGFDAAVSQVARRTEGPLADEFARVLQEMQIGLGRGAALRALGDRTHVPELRGFVSAMVQADALGIPVAHVLRVQAGEIRTRRRQRAEEQAQKVAVKILVPLIFCILPCLFIAVLGPAALSIFEAFSGRP